MTNKVHDTYLFDYSFSTPIQVKPGDILKSTCVFKSTGRAKTVFYGDGTNDEMCLGFLRFYPKQNVPQAFCVSFKELDQRALFTSQKIDSTNSNSLLTSSKLALSICIALYMFIFFNFVVY